MVVGPKKISPGIPATAVKNGGEYEKQKRRKS